MDIFYQKATSAAPASDSLVVVMLHGASSSSQVWNKIHTMHLIAAMGHHAIAVDLPGTYSSHCLKYSVCACITRTLLMHRKLLRTVRVI